MQKFIALLKDKRRGTLSQELLLAHVTHLRHYDQKGQIVLCGPFRDNDGAIQVIAANSIDEARQIVESDPFIAESYYNSYQLSELIEANESNNWLIGDRQTMGNVVEGPDKPTQRTAKSRP